MKKYTVLAVAVVLVVLFAAVSVDAFSFKFFKPVIKPAKVTPTSTSKAPAQSSGFCGHSTYGFCNSNSDCKQFGCSAQVCGSVSDPPSNQGTPCNMKQCYYNDGEYNMACGCLNNQCQWARPYQLPDWNQQGKGSQGVGQGQGSQGAGQGNGQSSQGQQGQGMGESQSQNQGEGSSFQCLNLPEEKKCLDGEGAHQYCTNVDGCYTKHNYNCGTGENGIQKCVADAVHTACLASC